MSDKRLEPSPDSGFEAGLANATPQAKQTGSESVSLLEADPASFVKGEIIAKGKTNTLYEVVGEPDLLIFQHGDMVADNDDRTFCEVSSKGRLNNDFTEAFAVLAEADHLPTHFIRKLNETERLVRKVKTLPFEVIVRNIVDGSFAQTLVKTGVATLTPHGETGAK